jgi:hypothetical protein
VTPDTPSVLYTQGHVDAQAAEIDRLRAELDDRDQRLSASAWREAKAQSESADLIRSFSREHDRLRAELADQYTRHAVVVMSRDEAEYAIARVRELCEPYAPDQWGITPDDVRAAIEGNQP